MWNMKRAKINHKLFSDFPIKMLQTKQIHKICKLKLTNNSCTIN